MKPDIQTAGIVNETKDTRFLVFLDYDNTAFHKVEKDLLLLKDAFGICTFVVLVNSEDKMINNYGETSLVGNYNVLSFCKLPFRKCEEAIGMTRCDASFRMHIRHYPQRNHVIRLACKFDRKGRIHKPAPKIKGIYHLSGDCGHVHSSAHIELVEELFRLKLPHFGLTDRIRELEVIKYNTQVKKEDFNG